MLGIPLAAVESLLAQPAISSQLIGNLNASMQLRALLTDVYLFGEVLRTQPPAVRQRNPHAALRRRGVAVRVGQVLIVPAGRSRWHKIWAFLGRARVCLAWQG